MHRLSLAVLIATLTACGAEPGDDLQREGEGVGGKADDPVVDADFGLDARPSNTTCLAPDRPAASTEVTTERAFSNLTFSQPLGMHQAPGDDSTWYVVEKAGRIRRFANVDSASTTQTFLDIRNIVESGPNEAGLLGMAFHPDYDQNGEVYLSFNMTQQQQLWSVVTRIRSTDGGKTLDPNTHEIVLSLQQPFGNHNGGQVAFGPDGMLYVGFGDGGSANDPMRNGQNTNTHLGKLLRIDVDHASGNAGYAIPSDNPFADGAGGRPEIYAWGLRNPWRFSWDIDTGDMWLADVGQDELEEIDLIVRGGNYGWSIKEAGECFNAPLPCDDVPVIDPVASYDHSQGDRSITGGFVYRGDDIGGLTGVYVYGDIVTGRIWGLFPETTGWEPRLLLESGVNMATFAQDHDGEIYVPNYFDGTIHKLVAAGGAGSDDFPQTLSATGCVDPSDPMTMAPGVIAYDVESPLWSDGAEKLRHFAIPDGAFIHFEQDGDFTFPVGSVLLKTFIVDGHRVETRLMVRHDDGGWGGYAYRWREDGSDADLLASAQTVDLASGETWRIPSRADCTACHTAAAGIALGPEFLQLNGDFVYEGTGRRANQMDTLLHIGMFDNVDEGDLDTEALPKLFGIDDDDASLQDRARSYLHSNCSSCHRPGGPGRSDADMRFLVSWAQQGMCGTPPEAGSLGLSDARLIRPGDPKDSVILHRMTALDASRMPALGSEVVDEAAAELLSAWIASLQGCP